MGDKLTSDVIVEAAAKAKTSDGLVQPIFDWSRLKWVYIVKP